MPVAKPPPIVEGVDYYMEEGKVVFTATYHLKRGYCCNSRCRHCPYGARTAAPLDPTDRVLPVLVVVGLPGAPGSERPNERSPSDVGAAAPPPPPSDPPPSDGAPGGDDSRD